MFASRIAKQLFLRNSWALNLSINFICILQRFSFLCCASTSIVLAITLVTSTHPSNNYFCEQCRQHNHQELSSLELSSLATPIALSSVLTAPRTLLPWRYYVYPLFMIFNFQSLNFNKCNFMLLLLNCATKSQHYY